MEGNNPQGGNNQEEADIDPNLLMEEILEKLKVLDYEALFTRTKGHKPLSRSYFAIKTANSNEQFVYFSSLSIWLLGLCGGQMSGDKKYDDPMTMANNLLTEMKNLGINCDVPPNKLRTGYGDGVCLVVSKLIDKALEKKKIQFKKLKIETEKTEKIQDGVLDIEEESSDPINMEIEYDDDGKQTGNNNLGGQYDNNDKSEIVSNILSSDVPVDEWQRELERVTSKLKMDYTVSSYSQSEWRSHVDQIITNEHNFAKTIPDSRSHLETLSGEIDRSLEKIRKKESMISKNFTNIISDYKGRQKETTDQYEEYNQLREMVEKLQREYDDIEEKIAEANNKFEVTSKSVSDTSSLSNMKQAIARIQSESLSHDMKIHILNHSILKYRQMSLRERVSSTNEGLDASMFDELL